MNKTNNANYEIRVIRNLDLEIHTRYSATDEPDEMGRWAREVEYKGLRIGWINQLNSAKHGRKFSCRSYFPIKSGDDPFFCCVSDTFDDAIILLNKEFRKFVVKLND